MTHDIVTYSHPCSCKDAKRPPLSGYVQVGIWEITPDCKLPSATLHSPQIWTLPGLQFLGSLALCSPLRRLTNRQMRFDGKPSRVIVNVAQAIDFKPLVGLILNNADPVKLRSAASKPASWIQAASRSPK